MLGLIVFIAYWIVAGPGGLAPLKQRKLARPHRGWRSWGRRWCSRRSCRGAGRRGMRPKRVEVSHLSFLDHVYGQRVRRAELGERAGAGVRQRGGLAGVRRRGGGGGEPVRAGGGCVGDRAGRRRGGRSRTARDYAVDSRDPQRLTFRRGRRSSSCSWTGRGAWRGTRSGRRWRRGRTRSARCGSLEPGSSNAELKGALIHNLPGMLEDVEIFLFRRQVPVRASAAGGPLLTARTRGRSSRVRGSRGRCSICRR